MLKSVLCMLLASAALQAGAEISRTGLYFEPNYGQFSAPSVFAARTSDTTVLLEPGRLRFHGASGVRSLEWIGNNRERSTWQPRRALPGVSNYYTERLRLSGVPHYAEVCMRRLYPGVAIRAYGTGGSEFEFDFEVARGADPSQIRWRVPEASAHISADGSLEAGSLRLNKPKAWQMVSGQRRWIEVSFTLTANGVSGFRLGSWDRRYALTIDPVVASVAWSTLIGGGGTDTVDKIATNAAGDVWVAGSTTSLAFGTGSAVRTSEDSYLAKLTANGTALAFVTFFGGSRQDTATSLSLDGSGNAVFGGTTKSTDLPVPGGFQLTFGGGDSDGFLVRVNASGVVGWASYIGGTGPEAVTAVGVRSSDRTVFAVGKGTAGVAHFPTLGTSETGTDNEGAFLARISAAGVLQFSILFGTRGTDTMPGELIVDHAGNPLVGGFIAPLQPDLYWRGSFVARFSGENGSRIATCYPTAGGSLTGLATDSNNRVYTFARLRYSSPRTGYVAWDSLFQLSPDLSTTLNQWQIPALWNVQVTSLVVAPDASSVWFGGTGQDIPLFNTGSLTFPSVLQTSGDYGASWSTTDFGTKVRSMVTNDHFVFAVTPEGLYRCPHGSSVWTLVLPGNVLAVAAASESSWVYGATEDTLYRSADDGLSFQVAAKLPKADAQAVAFSPSHPETVLVSYSRESFVSHDYGTSFKPAGSPFDIVAASSRNDDIFVRVNYGTSAVPGWWIERFSEGRPANFDPRSYAETLALDPRNDHVYRAYNLGPLQISNDRGATWNAVGTEVFTGQLAISHDGTFYKLTAGSIYTSTDGVTWISRASVPGAKLMAVAPKHSGRLYVWRQANEKNGFLLRFDTGTGAVRFALPTGGGAVNSLALSNGSVYAGGVPKGVGLPGMGTLNGPVPLLHDGSNGLVMRLREMDCNTSLSAATYNVAAGGGTGIVSVTAATCDWTATSASPWIRITGTSGGTVSFQVEPNPSGSARSGAVLIGVNRLVVTQPGSACTLLTTPSATTLTASAGVGSLTATLTPTYCAWAPQSDAPWLTLQTHTITGSGSISFSYTANVVPVSRTATITGGGLSHRVTQQAATCSSKLTAPTLYIGAAGGLVIAPIEPSHSACDSTASTTANWIRIETIGLQVNLYVATQPTQDKRTAIVVVNGQALQVEQAGSVGCPVQLSSIPATIGADGTNGKALTQTITALSPGCSWSAVPFSSSVVLRPLSGSGDGTVYWSVYPNFGTRARTVQAVVAGTPVTLTQAGSTESADRRFLRLVYFSFLGRLPTEAELTAQSAVLLQTTRTAFVSAVMNSAEFNLTSRFVAGLYVGLLNRDAEYSGYQFQREALRLGIATVPSLVTNFLNSAEYKLRYGHPGDWDFVRLLYTNILLREPTSLELGNQVTNLANLSRSSMAYSFLQSAEFYQGRGPMLTTFLLYASLLLRDPGGAERLTTMDRVGSGALTALIDEILKSAEFTTLLNQD